MQILLIVLIALHVLPGIFWAGTTFVLARTGGVATEQLAYPQLGSAMLSMLAGLALWGLLHRGFGTFELVLTVGVVAAIAAAGVQSGMGLPAIRRLKGASPAEATALRNRIAQAQRTASMLLAVTVFCMVTARYF